MALLLLKQGRLIVPNGGLGRSRAISLSQNTILSFDNNPEKVIVPADTITNVTNSVTFETNNGVADYLGTVVGNSSTILNITSQTGGAVRFRSNSPNFSGRTVVHAGAGIILDSAEDGNVLNGDVDVYGSFTGKGTINGNVTIRDGGYFLIGAEVGTQTHITGNLILEGGSRSYLSLLRNISDTLRVDGNITIDGALLLHSFEPDTLMNAPYTIITYGGNLTGTFDSITAPQDIDDENGFNLITGYPTNINYSTTGVVTIQKP